MPTLVIGVPGLWEKRTNVSAVCVEHGYVWAGIESAVINPDTEEPYPFQLEVHDPHPDLRTAFEAAGGGRVPDDILQRIEQHTMTLYVTTEEPNSLDLSIQLMKFAGVLLEAGGLAVKIETAGVAHPANRWKQLLELDVPAMAAYHGLVVRVAAADIGESYSCGMKHLGLPDAVVKGADSDSIKLLDNFAQFLAIENPPMEDGETFAVSEKGPLYTLSHGPCTTFPEDDLFHNPFGVWRLEPVEADPSP